MSQGADQLLAAPILVTGTPRSGKTLTASILSHTPGLVWVKEPLSIWATNARSRSDDCRNTEEATLETIKRIRNLCAQEVRRAHGSRYLDDLAYHTLRIEFIRAVMPDAFIVHVIQDGYVAIPQMVYGWTFREPFYRTIGRRWKNVNIYTLPRLAKRFLINHWASKVEGRRRAWGPQPPGLPEFVRGGADPAEIAAFQWRSMVEIGLADLALVPPEQAMTIRFEDLVADTDRVVTQLAKFCRIEDCAPLIRAANRIIQPQYTFDKRVELTPDQWRRVQRIIAPLRDRLGYTSSIPTALSS